MKNYVAFQRAKSERPEVSGQASKLTFLNDM